MMRVLLLLSAAVLGIALGCASSEKTDHDQDWDAPPPSEQMRSVMRAKMPHAHGLLAAIVAEDFALIERHASALTALSNRSDWIVHTTMAYDVHSADFRSITERIAAHAATRDLEAVTRAYFDMTTSCTRCHAYLRREGLLPDRPGELTRADPLAGLLFASSTAP